MAHTAKATVEQWRALLASLADGLPVAFLLGLMDRLSGGNPQFLGEMGGIGLFQIHPNTAVALQIDPAELWDPEVNSDIAIGLLRERALEITERDPAMAAERPGDLGLLTLASYLWGPGTILPRIVPGVTAAEVFAAIGDPAIGAFAVDVFNRSQAYSAGGGAVEPGALVVTGEAPKRSGLSLLLWILGLGGIAFGTWFVMRDRA